MPVCYCTHLPENIIPWKTDRLWHLGLYIFINFLSRKIPVFSFFSFTKTGIRDYHQKIDPTLSTVNFENCNQNCFLTGPTLPVMRV